MRNVRELIFLVGLEGILLKRCYVSKVLRKEEGFYCIYILGKKILERESMNCDSLRL